MNYPNQHTDDSSFMGYIKGMELLISSEEEITLFHNPHILKSTLMNNEKCRLKVVWISPQSTPCSFAFPKKSPILPFFNYIYHQLAETGIKRGQVNKSVLEFLESYNPLYEIR